MEIIHINTFELIPHWQINDCVCDNCGDDPIDRLKELIEEDNFSKDFNEHYNITKRCGCGNKYTYRIGWVDGIWL
jgi:hypothetical protein